MRIACAQLKPTIGDVHANVEDASDAIADAAREGASLVVLPELTTTGYVFESREEALALGEAVPDGPASTRFLELARGLEIYVVVGMNENDRGRLFNTSAVFGPTGFIGRFRKVHLWDRENLWFQPGDLGFPVFETPIGRIATFVCYDGWFPESYRACVLAGADMVCIPTNWVPIPGQDPTEPAMATYLCMASAHVNGVVVAAADRVGVERGQEFIGQSVIVNYTGWPIAGPASREKTQMLFADINLEAARRARTWNAFNDPVRDRRPESYTPMGRGPS